MNWSLKLGSIISSLSREILRYISWYDCYFLN
jgi:hypothetical protein